MAAFPSLNQKRVEWATTRRLSSRFLAACMLGMQRGSVKRGRPWELSFHRRVKMADSKRIALFLDGTWNNVSDNTNVWRLKSLCAKSPEQLVYYSAGVGTQFGERLSGGMFGIGINEEVISAYEWLVEHYEQDAQLFIFGFSRGAFTARSLAGFL